MARDELDRVDRALRRDADPRQDPQPVGVPRVLDRRDRRDVELAVEQQPVELRRHAHDLLHLRDQPDRRPAPCCVGDAAEAWITSPTAAARCRGCRAAPACARRPRTKRTSWSTFCSVSVRAPAAWKISSRTTVPCTSFAPKWSATAASGMPIMIQYALMFGTLSSISRETASIFRSSAPVVCRQPRRSKTVFSGWKASGMKARKPPVRSCCSRRRSRWSMRSS